MFFWASIYSTDRRRVASGWSRSPGIPRSRLESRLIGPRPGCSPWWLRLLLAIASWPLGMQNGSAQIDPPPIQSPPIDSINQAIEGLRSSSYLQRVRAQEKLAELGESALRPLALELLKSHPESSWRARQTLEKIGTSGTEATFLKAIGILQIFFNDGKDGSLELENKLALLKHQWRLERKNQILELFRSKGATVNDMTNSSNRFANGDPEMWAMQQAIELQWIGDDNPEIIIRQRGIRDDNQGQTTSAESQLQAVTDDESKPAKKITDKDLTAAVDSILAASIEENRKKLYKKQTRTKSPDNSELAGEVFLNLEIQRNLVRPGLEWQQQSDAIEIQLGPQWRGEDEDLDRLLEIDSPFIIGIDRTDLHPSQFTSLATLKNLVEVIVTGNELPAEKLIWLGSFANLKKLTFQDRQIDADTARALGKVIPIRYLSLTNCKLSTEAFGQLSELENLNYLNLRELDIPADAFDSLRSCPRLRFINLDICKFPKDAFLSFSRFRPDVQINFTPRAFLGVQAVSFDTDGNSCEISRVVPNSAADKAGLVAGDIIKKIDGQSIEKFEELRLHVAQYQPGERLELEVDRKGQRMNFSVELMPFDENIR